VGFICSRPCEGREELLPFVGRIYTKAKCRILVDVNPCFKRYVLQAEHNVFQDRDVVHKNVVGFINSSSRCSHIGNVLWEYSVLPKPWNQQEWGYTMTIVTKDISAGDELFAEYPVN
jgi:hypothetical protein